jgi:hypothetical protein
MQLSVYLTSKKTLSVTVTKINLLMMFKKIIAVYSEDNMKFISAIYGSMLSGSTVTTAWRVLGLRIEDTASRYGG